MKQGENIIVLEESTNSQYRFGMPGTELSKDEWEQCLSAVENIKDAQFIVASGSLPPGVPAGNYARLAFIATKKNAKLVVDTSGEALLQAAKAGVYLLKPNLGELSTLLEAGRIETGKIAEAANGIIAKDYCEVIGVSMGAAGAVLLTKDEFYRVVPPAVKRKSEVGAGDSMVAGIVLS